MNTRSKMPAKKVLFINMEMTPYLPETEFSKICRTLPQSIQEKGCEIRTFMPRFGVVNERRNQLHEVIRLSGINLIINDNDYPLIIKVASIQSARMQVYFIDNEDFFQKKQTTLDEKGVELQDNDDRCIFYVRGVLETVKKLRWIPDIVHCNGWLSALAPLYIKRTYRDDPCFKGSKVVYSVFNNSLKNPFNKDFGNKIMFDGIKDSDLEAIKENPDFVNLNKLAFEFSDGIMQGCDEMPSDLKKEIDDSGKLFLPYSNDDSYIDSVNEFYDKILEL